MKRRETRRHGDASRRSFMRGMATTGLGLAFARAASAQDAVLDSLTQSRSQDFGQGFDSASRTILMPNASLPTLDPSTAQTTEAAIARYEDLVARDQTLKAMNVPA